MSIEHLTALLAGLTLLIGSLTPILLELIRRNQSTSAEKVQEVKVDLKNSTNKVSGQLNEIHTMVNSDRTLMMNILKDMRKEIQDLNNAARALRGEPALPSTTMRAHLELTPDPPSTPTPEEKEEGPGA